MKVTVATEGKRYRHEKSGREYVCLLIGEAEDDSGLQVVYCPMNLAWLARILIKLLLMLRGRPFPFVRPLIEFEEKFTELK